VVSVVKTTERTPYRPLSYPHETWRPKKMWAGVGALEPARLDPRPALPNRNGRKCLAFFPFRALRRTGGFQFMNLLLVRL
jgi:hypothetical protein